MSNITPLAISELTLDNVGAICCVFRQAVLNEPANSFAKRHDISKAAISYFERGKSASLYSFLAYVSDGLFDYLRDLDKNSVQARIMYNKYHHKRIVNKK